MAARRSHVSSPHVSVSVDQHGIESILHDPPFTHAKVKRLRPVSTSPPDAASSDTHAQPPLAESRPTSDIALNAVSHPPSSTPPKRAPVSSEHPPDQAVSSPKSPRHSTSRSDSWLATSLLCDFLTASDKHEYQRISSQLPPEFHRIDAYLLLRERDPQSLSSLSYKDIFSLIKRAEQDGLGGVVSLLIEDIVGPDLSNPKTKPGHFQVFSGTEERYKLLREILMRCNQGQFVLHDGAALNIFMLMLDDLLQLRQSDPSPHEGTASLTTASSLAENAPIALPENFPVGETRRLVKLVRHLHEPELAPILKALRAHLEAHTPDFPTAREGAQLIAYYLQPNLRDFGAALEIVRALRDTNALAPEVVDDAIRDGKAYLAQLQASSSSTSEDAQVRPSDEELQRICMDVSLRLIAMKAVMAQRPKGGVQYRKAFESLTASFRLDLIDSHNMTVTHNVGALLDVPMRSVRSVFLHLVGQNDESCLAQALFVLQRSDQRVVAMLPSSDLQDFCDAARSSDALSLAAETYALVVKAKTSASSMNALPSERKHILARDALMVDTDTFLSLTQELLSNGQKIVVTMLLRALRLLPLTETSVGQLNLRFSVAQQPKFVALLAEAGLTDEAFALFQYWSRWRYEADSDSATLADRKGPIRNALSVQGVDPLIERQIRLMHDTGHDVATSAEGLVALVRALCHATLPSQSAQKDEASPVSSASASQLRKARFVIDVFRQSCTPVDWTHYRFTALAQACFLAKDVHGAFDALAKMSFLRQIPDQIDIFVLLGGLVDFDADKAVDLYIRHCTAPQTIGAEDTTAPRRSKKSQADQAKLPMLAPMKPTTALTSLLITRALAQKRTDLVDKLYAFAESVGIASRLGHVALLRAAFSGYVPPTKVVRTVRIMVQQGIPADPTLLEKLAQHLLQRSMKGVAVSETAASLKIVRKTVPSKERLGLVQAAVQVAQLSARKNGVANLRTVSRALDAIISVGGSLRWQIPVSTIAPAAEQGPSASVRTARQRGQEDRRLHWISCVDSIVHMLRWTKLFDTGDETGQGHSLWKTSQAGTGELVPAELDELVDQHGLIGSRQPTRAQSSAAAAATSPMLSEEAIHDDEAAPTDGVVQRLVQRSPNILPADLFCRIIEAYLALGDVSGAAEVASWMRDEAKVDLGRSGQETVEFVDRIKAAIAARPTKEMTSDRTGVKDESLASSSILRMLAGQQSTAHTKSWWLP